MDTTDPTSYRGIAIMEQTAKVYASRVLMDLEPISERNHTRARSQVGFRRECRIEDNIMIVR